MFIKSGAEFEHAVANILRENGHHAEVTKASGDYGVDLVLNGDVAVQVKFYGSVVGPAAVQEVFAGRAVYGCSQAWVITNSTFTHAAITLAKANGVRLISGEELQWLAENPDRSTCDGARYLAHLAEVRAQQEAAKAEHTANEEAAKAEHTANELVRIEAERVRRAEQEFGHDPVLLKIAMDNRQEAVRISSIVAWKVRREIAIAAGAKTDADEQSRLANAARILAEVGYEVPESRIEAERVRRAEQEFGHDPVLLKIAIDDPREAARISSIVSWKVRREAEIAAGAETDAYEQSRLARAARILAEVGYEVPESKETSRPSRQQPDCDQATGHPAPPVDSAVPCGPPAAWYPDPTGATTLRWWDGEDWTAATH